MINKPLIYDLSQSDFVSYITTWGEAAYRAQQIWKGLYKNFWNNPEEFTNLPIDLRNKLKDAFSFSVLKPISQIESSDNKTTKILFQLVDGNAIETVLMKYELTPSSWKEENQKQGRRTLCISTQVGCAMGCVFCATGQMGFKRHLSKGEIIAQIMYFARTLSELGEKVTNIVIMGMGEPFHNYENTLAAIDQLNDLEGYNFGARRFTISTVGLVPAIDRFTKEKKQVNLAISLHAADNQLRSTMLPINKRYPIEDVLAACHEYTRETGRRITFEWALIKGINDTPQQAKLLAKKLKGLLCHVNAIPLNPTDGYTGRATTRERAKEFKEILNASGIPCTIRLRRGIDIQAGCGQLAVKHRS